MASGRSATLGSGSPRVVIRCTVLALAQSAFDQLNMQPYKTFTDPISLKAPLAALEIGKSYVNCQQDAAMPHSMPWYQRLSLYTMNLIAPDMVFTGRGLPSLGIRPTDDIEVSRDLSRDPLFIKATRVSSLAGVTQLMGRAQNLSTSPPQRSLVLYGLRDRIIPPSPVCDWLTHLNAAGAPSAALDFVVYPEGWHLLTRQLQTREVLQDLEQWLQQSPLPRRQSLQQAQAAVCTQRP